MKKKALFLLKKHRRNQQKKRKTDRTRLRGRANITAQTYETEEVPWQNCSERQKQKRVNCKKRINPSDQKRVFLSSEERLPRDASPMSVILGVGRGQVLVLRFIQLPLLPLLFAATAAQGTICARYDVAAAVVVGTSRRKSKRQKQVGCCCTWYVH